MVGLKQDLGRLQPQGLCGHRGSAARAPFPGALQTGDGSEDGSDAVRLEDEALGHWPPLPRRSGVHTHAELGSAGEAGVGTGLPWSSVRPSGAGGGGGYLLQIQEVLLTLA